MEFLNQLMVFDNDLPPGFRFHPTDEELITCYLLRKVLMETSLVVPLLKLILTNPNHGSFLKTLVFYRGRAPKGEKSNWVMHEYRLDGKFAYHFISKSSKDEWVISRVFQKSGVASAGSTSGASGGMKRMNPYQEVNSSASVSLPPLLDTSPYNGGSTAAAGDHDSFSYDSNAASKEHVPCFSTASACSSFDTQPIFDFPAPPPPLPAAAFSHHHHAAMDYEKNVGVSAFPSLRALQENLQLPFFYSAVAPPQPPIHGGDGGICSFGGSGAGSWFPAPGSSAAEDQKPGPTELDCIWSF
ncbi:hypothetical protein OSB04_030398 [Centaurea solstitialis]|uniref:NAC domain-containing protein n=1 Tax=Centaurea solstitialis TaxID=347529 RepID=A0AA38W3S1_9ASTR|nr:hypothetical protein OSB04_030398 [Centaurea solstitialis]